MGLINQAVQNMDHPDMIERYAVVDLVTKEYMVYSEYEVRNGLIARSWLEYTFISPFVVFQHFMLDDEVFDEFRNLVSNGGCGYITDSLYTLGRKTELYGVSGKYAQAFRVPVTWTRWAEVHGLDGLQQARLFGTGYDAAKIRPSKMVTLSPLVEALGCSSARIQTLKVRLILIPDHVVAFLMTKIRFLIFLEARS